jgi:hypothetical protein
MPVGSLNEVCVPQRLTYHLTSGSCGTLSAIVRKFIVIPVATKAELNQTMEVTRQRSPTRSHIKAVSYEKLHERMIENYITHLPLANGIVKSTTKHSNITSQTHIYYKPQSLPSKPSPPHPNQPHTKQPEITHSHNARLHPHPTSPPGPGCQRSPNHDYTDRSDLSPR